MSGNDFLNKNVLRWRRKVDRDAAEVISFGSWYHVWGPETENARLPIVDSLTAGAVRRLVTAAQSAKPVSQAGKRHGQMVPDITVPYHSWLCRLAERSYTLCALVSAASGDRQNVCVCVCVCMLCKLDVIDMVLCLSTCLVSYRHRQPWISITSKIMII